MNATELIFQRQSCRSFGEGRVEDEKLLQIIEAGRLSPSACNSQPWSFVLASSHDKVKEVSRCTQINGRNTFTENASAFIIIVEEENEAAFGGREHRYYGEMDIGMCTVNMCNMATSLGVGSCILGSFDADELKEVADIPRNKCIKLVIALGYAKEGYPQREKTRKSREEVLKII